MRRYLRCTQPAIRDRRSRTLFACVALAATLAPSASAIESTIYPGVGIGKVRLGMTQSQVKQALGKWRFVNERKGRRLSVGWGFGEWTVEFLSGRVVEVTVTLDTQKTKSGVGPGSSWRSLVRAYPHGVCVVNNGSWGGRAEYLVPHKGGTQTIYWVRAPERRNPYTGQVTTTWRVSEVHVRTPWMRLPEFQPTSAERVVRCKADWRTGDAPA